MECWMKGHSKKWASQTMEARVRSFSVQSLCYPGWEGTGWQIRESEGICVQIPIPYHCSGHTVKIVGLKRLTEDPKVLLIPGLPPTWKEGSRFKEINGSNNYSLTTIAASPSVLAHSHLHLWPLLLLSSSTATLTSGLGSAWEFYRLKCSCQENKARKGGWRFWWGFY